jgi:hypothetical protein
MVQDQVNLDSLIYACTFEGGIKRFRTYSPHNGGRHITSNNPLRHSSGSVALIHCLAEFKLSGFKNIPDGNVKRDQNVGLCKVRLQLGWIESADREQRGKRTCEP